MLIGLTGSSGFIGKNLLTELLNKGYRVRVFLRNPKNTPTTENLEVIVGDFNDKESLKTFVSGVDAIVHCAGAIRAIKSEDYINGNYIPTKNLVDAIQELRPDTLKKFIFLSSQSAQGPSWELAPRRLDAPPEPVSWYGKSKLMAENYIVNHLEYPYFILRLASVYGPGDRETLRFFKYVKKGIFPLPAGDKYLNMVYVKDVVSLILHLLEAKLPVKNKIYFVGHPEYTSLTQIAKDIKTLLGKKTLFFIPVPKEIVKIALSINEFLANLLHKPTIATREKANELVEKYWIGDPQPLLNDTSFTFRYNLMEGLYETLEWYRSQGWL